MDTGALSSAANQSHTLPAGYQTEFTYTPLDYCAPSIRLLRIHPETSFDDLIQCQLHHASTTSTYRCLSYVWGDDSWYYWILVNGQRFRVRRNLYSFLRVAWQQKQCHSHWFWIDAICIDQSNGIERNHQVKQMGDIFAGAEQVVAWLGTHKGVTLFLETSKHGENKGASTQGPRKLRKRRQIMGITERDTQAMIDSSGSQGDNNEGRISTAYLDAYRQFCFADYWDRAWITQEVALARQITFMAGEVSLSASSLSFDLNYICDDRIGALDPRTTHELRGRSLIYLMDRFKAKKSCVVRDRVFSLLSLCGEGSDVTVDYGVTELEVAENVLNCCRRSFCLCSIGIVAHVLGVQTELTTPLCLLNSRREYAQITLPVTTDSETFRTSENLPALYEPDYNDSRLTLKIRALCRSYRGRLRVSPVRIPLLVSYGHEIFDEWRTHTINGCSLELSNDQQSCTAIFSSAFLYEIIQFNRSLMPCCERVTYEGTSSAWTSSMPALTLCE